MRIDQTRIAVRERTAVDLFDLALLLMGRQGAAIGMYALAGILPFFALNTLLLYSRLEWTLELEGRWNSLWWAELILVYTQSSLATSAVTIYLGRMMFRESTSPRAVFSSLTASWFQLFWYQGLWRGALVVPFLMFLIPRDEDVQSLIGVTIMPLLLFVFFKLRNPYLNEIVLLERNPWRKGNSPLNTAKRSRHLHSGASAWVTPVVVQGWVVAVAGYYLLSLGAFFVLSILAGGLERSPLFLLVHSQTIMWLLAVYFSVVRFLGYLDLRIRREGWEVELVLRDAARHLQSLGPTR